MTNQIQNDPAENAKAVYNISGCRQGKMLKLIVHGEAFEVMHTGEKQTEYRKPSKWIESRLKGRHYDYIEIRHGYGRRRPYFIAVFIEAIQRTAPETVKRYSNGLEVTVSPGDWEIDFSFIVQAKGLK